MSARDAGGNNGAPLPRSSAQRAMSQGGYERAAGTEGGFRSFVKDAQKQQELIEQESLSGGESVAERNFERAKAAYDATPMQPDVINSYGNQLKKRGDDESLALAKKVFLKGFEDTAEYRFRVAAGEIDIAFAQQKHSTSCRLFGFCHSSQEARASISARRPRRSWRAPARCRAG